MFFLSLLYFFVQHINPRLSISFSTAYFLSLFSLVVSLYFFASLLLSLFLFFASTLSFFSASLLLSPYFSSSLLFSLSLSLRHNDSFSFVFCLFYFFFFPLRLSYYLSFSSSLIFSLFLTFSRALIPSIFLSKPFPFFVSFICMNTFSSTHPLSPYHHNKAGVPLVCNGLKRGECKRKEAGKRKG